MAGYIVLLGAQARGLASYWRTLTVLDTPAGREAVSLPDDQEPVGLLHLGQPRQEQLVPERAPVESVVRYLE
jgi:nitroreductase